jgi:hypothetical protein
MNRIRLLALLLMVIAVSHTARARDYEATTGRYIESDPIGLDGGLNTYQSVDSRPLSRIDPRGTLSFGPSCSTIQRIQVSLALTDMAAELLKNSCDNTCTTGHCMPCDKAKKIIDWYLTTATVNCSESSRCGNTAPNINTTNVGLLGSYISTGKPEGCGCLSSTLLHEALHIRHALDGNYNVDTDERPTRDETKKCIGCARND